MPVRLYPGFLSRDLPETSHITFSTHKRALYLEYKVPFQLYFGFHRSGFTKNIHYEFSTNTLQTMYVWLKTVSNERHFTYENQVPLRPYLKISLEGFSSYFIPRTLHACATYDVPLAAIGQWWRDFTEKTELVFVCIWASIGVIFPKLKPLYFPRMRYKRCRFGCDRAITKSNLLSEESTFFGLLWLEFEKYCWNFTHRTFRPCARECVSFIAIWR